MIASLLFVDDVVMFASLSPDLECVLGWFAAVCKAAAMRISTSISEAMVLIRKKVAGPLQVDGETLPQVEHEIDRRMGANVLFRLFEFIFLFFPFFFYLHVINKS